MQAPSKDLKKLYKRQTVLQFMVFTLITIFVWVGFSLFRSQKKTSITAEQLKLAAPLTPNIDQEVLSELENKVHFEEAELANFPIYQILVEETEQRQAPPSPSPLASPQVESSIPIDLGSMIAPSQEEVESSTNSATTEAL